MLHTFRAILVFVLVVGVFAGAWSYVNRQRLAWQWACYEVGSAGSYDEARRQLAWFEQGSDAPERLRVLVGKWGGGNPRFDQYLARYATDGESSTALRQTFSSELGRRPDLLPRWAHYWCWQTPLAPSRQIASILTYLDTLAFDDGASANAALTWREVLDLQAIFTISGDTGRAARVTPETWREYYRVWREASQPALENVPRPAEPLPAWATRSGPDAGGIVGQEISRATGRVVRVRDHAGWRSAGCHLGSCLLASRATASEPAEQIAPFGAARRAGSWYAGTASSHARATTEANQRDQSRAYEERSSHSVGSFLLIQAAPSGSTRLAHLSSERPSPACGSGFPCDGNAIIAAPVRTMDL